MAQGSKSKYTAKQKRKAAHIEEGYEKRGVSKAQAEKRAWRTVNKQDGGAKKSSTRAKRSSKSRTSRTARKKSSGTRRRSSAKKR